MNGVETEPANMLGPTLARLSKLRPLIDAKQAGMDTFAAPRLNSFETFNPGEVSFCARLANLWDPRGTHGQGALFLNALLAWLELPEVDQFERPRVRTEVSFGNRRRIDILIETNDAVIGIEVKLGADEALDQLTDYKRSINELAGFRERSFVFLAPNEPSDQDWCHLPYSSDDQQRDTFVKLMTPCVSRIRAPRARFHVEDMLSFIRDFGSEQSDMTETDKPYVDAVRQAFESDNRKAVAMTLLAQTTIHKTIVQEIESALRESVTAFPGKLENIGSKSLYKSLRNKDTWLLRSKRWSNNLAVGLCSERGPFRNVHIGIYAPRTCPEVDPEYVSDERTQVEKAAANISGSATNYLNWLPWWTYLREHEWDHRFAARLVLESHDGDVLNTAFVGELTSRFVQLWEACEEVAEAR
ncbi:MAG: PD-(D/E)XK nuclease family protein [Pacificimonas sp.]